MYKEDSLPVTSVHQMSYEKAVHNNIRAELYTCDIQLSKCSTSHTDTMVGFERATYTLSEDVGSVDVCINVQAPSMGSVTISTAGGTAIGQCELVIHSIIIVLYRVS